MSGGTEHRGCVVEPPTARELLPVVAAFLNDEVSPLVQDEKVRFRVRVAANLLRIAERELANVAALRADRDGYLVTDELLQSAGSLNALTAALLSGERDILDPDTFGLLERYVAAKLRIAAPTVLGTGS